MNLFPFFQDEEVVEVKKDGKSPAKKEESGKKEPKPTHVKVFFKFFDPPPLVLPNFFRHDVWP